VSSGFDQVECDELLAWRHFKMNFHFLLSQKPTLWESVVLDVGVEVCLEEVFHSVGDVLEPDWQLRVFNFEVSDVDGGSLVFANPETNWGDGESFPFILNALLGLWRLGTSPLSHFLSTLPLSVDFDVVWHLVAVFSESDFSVFVDDEILSEESFAEDEELTGVGPGWDFPLAEEFEALLDLLALNVGFHHVLSDGFQ